MTSPESAKHIVRLRALPGDDLKWLHDLHDKFAEQILSDIEKQKDGENIPIDIDDTLYNIFTSTESIFKFSKFNGIYIDNDKRKYTI